LPKHFLNEEMPSARPGLIREAAQVQASTLDALPAHIAILDVRGEILAVNEHWRQFARENCFTGDGFGVGANYLEICGRSHVEGCEEARMAGAAIREVLAGIREQADFEYPCHAGNQQRWFRMMVTPLRANGIEGAVVMHVDVSARKFIELALDGARRRAERQAERLRLLSEIAAQLLAHDRPRDLLSTLFSRVSAHLSLEVYFNFLVSPDGSHLTLASYAGVPGGRATGLRRLEFGQAVCGTVARTQVGMTVEDVSSRCDEMTALIRELGITAYFCHPLLANGRLIGTLSFGTRQRPRFEPDEIELLRTIADQVAVALERSQLIAELVDREREAREAREAAEAASRTKDEFLAALSHELRTPLTPVLLSVQTLKDHPRLPAELLPELERMRRNVVLEARLIDDLLDLTRIARGKIQLHPEILDAHALLERVIETCIDPERGTRPRPELDFAAAESWVWGDPARLEQVFWNLLSNAFKFSGPEGCIRVRTSNEPPGWLRIEVIDNGPGIAEEALSRIFNAFEQGGRHVGRRFGGLGLGLAISKSLVELHGGAIMARSEGPGTGATFSVELASVPAPLPDAPPEESSRSEPRCSLHVLLVEDHADTADALADLLRDRGHRVAVARTLADAREAVRTAQEGEDRDPLDLIVSDLGLPDGSGIDLMRELSARYGLRGIALSGYGMDEDVRRSLEAGFTLHLTKPVAPSALIAALHKVASGF
jgi:signal transduction histidine kinase/ActR/RegA family two-component response regulator